MDKSNAFVSHDIRESVGSAENINIKRFILNMNIFLCFYLNLNCKYIKVIYPTFES